MLIPFYTELLAVGVQKAHPRINSVRCSTWRTGHMPQAKGVSTFAEGSGVDKLMGVNASNGTAGHVAYIIHAYTHHRQPQLSNMIQHFGEMLLVK